MKRICVYVAGLVVALIPAVLGLTGNASFSQSVPVHAPDKASSDDSGSTPTPTPSHESNKPSHKSHATHDAADDRGRGNDDGPNHDSVDDRGGDRATNDDGPNHDAGDDHGGDRGD